MYIEKEICVLHSPRLGKSMTGICRQAEGVLEVLTSECHHASSDHSLLAITFIKGRFLATRR